MDIITVGEMVIDFLPGGEKGVYVRNAGGAPANVAIAAARNGLKAGIYAKMGNDDFGRFLIDTLKENQVAPLSPILTDEAVTTMAFVSLDENNDRSFTFARKPGADMMLSKDEIDDQVIADTSIVQAGSCSLSAGKAVEATIHTMRRAHELGKMVGFDVNYRNLMWNDNKQACTEKVKSILPYVDFLKISDEEADMVGGEDNIFSLMQKNDISVVVLTLGSDGAKLFYKEKSYYIPSFTASEVADTTGAGDAFWGGFLSRLLILGCHTTEDLNAELLLDAVTYGNVSGMLAVTKKGAIASLPTREQIEIYLKEVR